MEVHLKIIGCVFITLALVHIVFPKYFNWAKELSTLSLINRQMMVVHTFFIALTVFLMGVLCLTSSTALLETTLGKKISLGLGIFWIVRLFIQFFRLFNNTLEREKIRNYYTHCIFFTLDISKRHFCNNIFQMKGTTDQTPATKRYLLLEANGQCCINRCEAIRWLCAS